LRDAYLRIRRYQRAWGVLRGVFTWLKLWHARTFGRAMVRLWVPGLLAPIELRPRTADRMVFENIFLDGQYDIQVHDEPHLIIDGGAHIGCASVFFATRYRGALIIAVEPEASNFELLRRNVSAYTNVLPVRAALWNQPRQLAIANREADSWAFRAREADSGDQDTMIGVTIDEILAWAGASWIDILKLDVEGAERELFSDPSCRRWLGAVRWIIIELHDRFVEGCTDAFEEATSPLRISQWRSGECVVVRCG